MQQDSSIEAKHLRVIHKIETITFGKKQIKSKRHAHTQAHNLLAINAAMTHTQSIKYVRIFFWLF